MPGIKFVISEPETRKAYQLDVDYTKVVGIFGKKIGEEFNGDLIGLNGYSLKITGGSDKDGFPMHPDVKGPGRKRVLLAGKPGFHPKIKGQRKRKIVRGDTLSDAIAQVNVKVVKRGEKPLDQIVPTKPKEKKVEEVKEKKEEPKEEKKEVKAEEEKQVKEEKAEVKKEKPKEEKVEKKEEKKEGEQAKK
jgi:small subunit ribosomal protein S6e